MTTEPGDDDGRITELPEDECLALLTTTTVGRMAFVDDDGQQLVPVNFACIDGAIYYRTRADGFLAGPAQRGSDVAFGVDRHDDLYRTGWNVTVKGRAEVVEDPDTIETVLTHRLRPWAGGVRLTIVRVTIDSISGRKVVGH